MIPFIVQTFAPTFSRVLKLCLFLCLYITFPLFFHDYYYHRIVHTWESESETEQKTTKINWSSSDAKAKWGAKQGINFLIYLILQEQAPVLQLNYMDRYIKYIKLLDVVNTARLKDACYFVNLLTFTSFPLTQKPLRYYCIYI